MKLPSKYTLVDMLNEISQKLRNAESFMSNDSYGVCINSIEIAEEIDALTKPYKKVRRRKAKNVGSEVQGN